MRLKRLLAFVFFLLAGTCAAYATGQNPHGATQNAPASAYTSTEPASGKTIYAKRCEICHFSGSKAKKIGVGFAGLYGGGTFSNGKKVDDDAVRQWIELGGKDMPGFKDALKANEVRDLIAYLRTL